MKFRMAVQDITEYRGDVLIVNLFEGVEKPSGATGAVDKALGGAVSKLIARGEFKGKRGETAVLPGAGKVGAERVVVVGLGKKEKFERDIIRLAAAESLKKAESIKAEKVGTILHGAGAGGTDTETAAAAVAEGAILGLYKFDKYRTGDGEESPKKKIKELAIVVRRREDAVAAGRGVRRGEILADAANRARDLVNEPPNVLTPLELANRARQMAKGRNLKVRVFGRDEIARMGMNAFLGVARGSSNPPVLIEIEYRGNPKSDKTMAFIGKGITFDSGGLSLKNASAMDDMKTDMSGAAAVICAMDAIERLGPKINITALAPATDNMPDGNAQKIGDIVRAMNGKTIEIKNTDAEGRLILADAVCYAVKKKMSPIVDLATLTGACMVALGHVRTGLFSTDDELAAAITAAGELAGERMWRLPTDDDYREMNKSEVADIKNTGNRWAGATTGALFIEFFTNGTPWAHLDIAGTASLEKKYRYYPAGATGVGVRTLANLALDMAPR